jgi:TolB protein
MKNRRGAWLVLGAASVLVLLSAVLGGWLLRAAAPPPLPPTLALPTAPPQSLPPTWTAPAPLPVTPTRPPPPTRAVSPTPTDPPPSPTPERPAGRIVFTCTPGDYNQICVINPDGSGYRQLTDGKAHAYYPSLTTDARGRPAILFASNRGGKFELWETDLAGERYTQLTEGLGAVAAPEASPNGQALAFTVRGGFDSSIFLSTRSGDYPFNITELRRWSEIDPTWSPDGLSIAFAAARETNTELWVMSTLDWSIRQVTRGVKRIGGRASWAPDGRSLAFYAGPAGDRDLFLVDVATGASQQITFGGNNTGPSFSPDGRWIVFASNRDGDFELYRIHPDGSTLVQLTDNTWDDWQPRWGP